MKDMYPNSLYNGFRHAINGIIYCCATQLSMRIHALAALMAIILAFYVHLSAEEWILLILTIVGVMIAEIGNTALETIVDLRFARIPSFGEDH